jgi:hypothetical protein
LAGHRPGRKQRACAREDNENQSMNHWNILADSTMSAKWRTVRANEALTPSGRNGRIRESTVFGARRGAFVLTALCSIRNPVERSE